MSLDPRDRVTTPGTARDAGVARGVSAVITCYNAAWCIERALDSVFAQTRVPEEILVTDDGSTDDTVALIASRYGDAVRVLELPHRGLTPSRMAAIEACRGPWFAIMDADDTWLPEKIEAQMRFVERHPEVAWVSSDGRLESADGVLAESWLADYFTPVEEIVGDLFPHLVQRCFPLVSSSLVRKDAYHAVGGMDDRMEWSQDYSLWLRLAARYPAGLMKDVLTTYWSGPHQLSRRVEARNRDDQRLMERVARGEYRKDPVVQKTARLKVAAMDFELGLSCLRSGRYREGQVHLWRAARAPGPFQRRAIALFGALTPRAALRHAMHSSWIKTRVQRSRRVMPRMGSGGGAS